MSGFGIELDQNECQRAEGYRFESDRRRFVAGRLFQRFLLSKYTGNSAANIQYTASSFGKLSLRESDSRSFKFNLSRSGGYGV